MTRQYRGRMFYEIEGVDSTVSLARCSSTELAIDWIEDGVASGLVATSSDGIMYEGRYFYRDDTPDGQTELRLYRTKEDWLILFGSWEEDGTHDRGHWVFQLQPV